MKPTNNPFKFDRTKKLSRNNKIAAGLFIFFGLLFLYNEWEWRDRQDRELKEIIEKREAETKKYCEEGKRDWTLGDYQSNPICYEYERKIKKKE